MTTDEKATESLRELAHEFGLSDVTDPDSIRRRILFRLAERDSRARQLESRIDVFERHRVPHLEAQLHEIEVDLSAWRERARSAEATTGKLLWAYVGLVALGLAGCIAIPLLAY